MSKLVSLFVLGGGIIVIIPFLIGSKIILSDNTIEHSFGPFKPGNLSWNDVDTVCFVFGKKDILSSIEIRSRKRNIIVDNLGFGEKPLKVLWKSLLKEVKKYPHVKLRQRKQTRDDGLFIPVDFPVP